MAANLRYWTTIAPRVRQALLAWEQRARAIPDPVLRAHALEKLREERGNTEVTSTLATLAPRQHRQRMLTASVALQVMYDYLDAVTEQPVQAPLRNARLLLSALQAPFEPRLPIIDYYRHHPQHEDGGYLHALISACHWSLHTLPRVDLIGPAARAVAARCAEAQARSHAVGVEGVAQLRSWATPLASAAGMSWWEFAGGTAASVLSLHALMAVASDTRSTQADAEQTVTAYTWICTLVTMLDSLVDCERDLAEGRHSYVGYYRDAQQTDERLRVIAQNATVAASRLRHASHHVVTTAGVAAFYLSTPNTATDPSQATAARVIEQLRPIITPTLLLFRGWRRWSARRERPRP